MNFNGTKCKVKCLGKNNCSFIYEMMGSELYYSGLNFKLRRYDSKNRITSLFRRCEKKLMEY